MISRIFGITHNLFPDEAKIPPVSPSGNRSGTMLKEQYIGAPGTRPETAIFPYFPAETGICRRPAV
jgi:hypothetical protein